MLGQTALLSVLLALIEAAPVPTLGGLGGLDGLGGLGSLGGLKGGHSNSGAGHGLLDGQSCYVDGRRGTVDGLLCIIADLRVNKRDHSPYGFGWFHPGAFTEGDECWYDGHGIIHDSLCVIADLSLSARGRFDGYFNKPYYGYGHRFGWYHPGPFVQGDECYQDGQRGIVQDAICIIADIEIGTGGHNGGSNGLLGGLSLGGSGLGKRITGGQDAALGGLLSDFKLGGLLGKRTFLGPEYWNEPYFLKGYNFGWFHDGPFADGDRCWSEGHYGSVLDSLCVLADLNVDIKRDLLGGLLNHGTNSPSFRDGDICHKDGMNGRWYAGNCDSTLALDVIVDDLNIRSLPLDEDIFGDLDAEGGADITTNRKQFEDRSSFNHFPPAASPCYQNGKSGILNNGICVLAEVVVSAKRDNEDMAQAMEDGVAAAKGEDSTSENVGQSSQDSYEGDYEESNDSPSEDAETGDDSSEGEGWEKRSPLLSSPIGETKSHAVSKLVSGLVSDMKTRGAIFGSGTGVGGKYEPWQGTTKRPEHEVLLSNIEDTVGLTRRKILGNSLDGHGVAFLKRQLNGLGLNGLTGSKGQSGQSKALLLNGLLGGVLGS